MKSRLATGVMGVIAALAGLISCTEQPRGEIRVTEVAPGAWSPSVPAEVVYENGDTLRQRRLAVLIRFRNDFAHDRLDFVVATTTPDSLTWRDTLTVRPMMVFQATSLTYIDAKIPYRSRTVLSRTGKYRFAFTPLSSGEGVIGVGIEIIMNQE